MSNNQDDLFADDHQLIGQLFDNLDHIPEQEIEKSWSSVLLNLIALIKSELIRQGEVPERVNKITPKIVGIISHYMGGRALYLPRGDKIKEALRDYDIYDQFSGNNVPELAKRYGLSEPHIYAIIRKQRRLIRCRTQPDLFDTAHTH